jgi:histidinol-phosphate aminotransferase
MNSFERRNAHFDRLFATKNLYWLGQNTNHLPMHTAVRKAILASIEAEEFHAYAPPGGFTTLVRGIIDDVGLPHDTTSALVTEGAVAALAIACRAYCKPGSNFVTTDPGWKWPMQFARQAGAEIREIPIYDPGTCYRLTAEQLGAAVDNNTRIIYLVDPNNPLGVCYTEEEIRAFCDIARNVGAYILHDSTYRDFADGHCLAARFYPERAITIYSFRNGLVSLVCASVQSSLTVGQSSILRRFRRPRLELASLRSVQPRPA